jgi:hypothetical protein
VHYLVAFIKEVLGRGIRREQRERERERERKKERKKETERERAAALPGSIH